MTDSATPTDTIREHRNRLRWQCRRGTLELDTVLMDFLEHGYHTLAEGERQVFEQLLRQSDATLQAWLFGHQEVTDKGLRELVRKI